MWGENFICRAYGELLLEWEQVHYGVYVSMRYQR